MAWEKAKGASLGLYLHDVLFGGGFIGFNSSMEIGVPSYVDGMPAIDGTLDLRVMNKEWAMEIAGKADLLMMEMEATLGLQSYNGSHISSTGRRL